MFQQSTSFTENRYNVHCFGCPVTRHKPGQCRITVSHLDRKGQITYIFKKTKKHSNIIIPEIPLLNDQIDYVKPPNQ